MEYPGSHTWIRALEVGEKVIICRESYSDKKRMVAVVEKRTPSGQIVVTYPANHQGKNRIRFMPTGREIGAYNPYRLMPYTEEKEARIWQKMAQKSLEASLLKFASQRNLSHLTAQQCREITTFLQQYAQQESHA